ncbi:MAG TPA: O-antigen ligase family protein [Patescibacteria group bacterium]|nr:O-antigen ligase family protein [Patescibacteria group bacterium]
MTRTFKVYSLLLQAVILFLIALGMLPDYAVWVTVALVSAVLLFAKLDDAVEYFILSIPFFFVLPGTLSDSFSSWRVYLSLLGLRTVPWLFARRKQIFSGVSVREPVFWLICFLTFMALSSLWAHFPVTALKQVIFWTHLAWIIPIAYVSRITLHRLFSACMYSLAIYAGFGFIQLIIFTVSDFYFFWQFWANNVTSVLFGKSLSMASTYSNSWFDMNDGSLRMFSLFPSSHAFGLAMMFLIATVLMVGAPSYLFVGAAVLLALSQSRGVWVGSLASALSAGILWLYVRGTGAKRNAKLYACAFLLLISAPVVNFAVGVIKETSGSGLSFERGVSIFDLQESSNAGRLAIWRDTLRYAASHPFGTGAGNFVVSLFDGQVPSSITEAGETLNKRYNLPQKYISAHNLYLHELVELGMIGFSLFFAFIGSIFFKLWARRYEYIPSVLLVLFAGIFTYMLFDTTLLNDRLLLYFFILFCYTNSVFHKKSA